MEPIGIADSGWEAGVVALREGRIDDAIAQLQSFVEANPDSFEGNNFLGVALAQAKRSTEAIYFLMRATRLNPGSAQAHYNLGLALLGSGDSERARVEFETALHIEPQYMQAQQALQRLPAPEISTHEISANATPPFPEPVAHMASIQEVGSVPVLNVRPSAALTAVDVLKALVFGSIAAIVGAFIWDKITYYTNMQIGLVAVGVGVLVGMGVSKGAGGKSSTALKVMGAVLAGIGILFGQALIIMDTVRAMPAAQTSEVGSNPILLLLFSILVVPKFLVSDPLSLIFIAIGVYEGWKFAGAGAPVQEQSTLPVPQATTSEAQLPTNVAESSATTESSLLDANTPAAPSAAGSTSSSA